MNAAARHDSQQASRGFQFAIHERQVEDQLCRLISDLRLPPRLNLALQRLEVPLNPVHADRECVNQVEALAVLRQDSRENTSASYGAAREDNARLPVHPVDKMQKLVLLGRQGGKGRKGGKQRISCIHASLRLCSLRIRDLQK